jgi:hypothetical protein
MAYDAARQRVVLFGGSGPEAGRDTWEWDGTTWIPRFPETRPPERWLHSMTYDPVRARIVMFGGRGLTGPLRDTWEWDGNDWTELDVAPPPGGDPAIAYDEARQRLVLFRRDLAGGAQTWELGATIAGGSTAYGTACATGGAPRLDAFGRPFLGNPSFALDVLGAPPSTGAAFLFAAGEAHVPLGACTLLVDPTTALAVSQATTGAGFASLRLPVPAATDLLGVELFAQAALVDPSSAAGLALTRGLRMRLGE